MTIADPGTLRGVADEIATLGRQRFASRWPIVSADISVEGDSQ